jgi:hypothetical protein
MSTVHITAGGAMGGGAPVYAPIPDFAQTITSSGTSQRSSAMPGGKYVSVTSSGGAVFVAIGQNPTAVSGAGYMVADGATKDFGPIKEGDKVALIDVA